MKPTKIQSALILFGFAALANAQSTSLLTASDRGTSYVHTAQAPNNQTGSGGGAPGNQGGQQHKGPPPQAIEACQWKSVGAVCSFNGRNGEALTGTCFAPPAGGQTGAPGAQGNHPIACRPDRGGQSGMQQGKQRGPNATQGGQG